MTLLCIFLNSLRKILSKLVKLEKTLTIGWSHLNFPLYKTDWQILISFHFLFYSLKRTSWWSTRVSAQTSLSGAASCSLPGCSVPLTAETPVTCPSSPPSTLPPGRPSVWTAAPCSSWCSAPPRPTGPSAPTPSSGGGMWRSRSRPPWTW